MRGWKAASTRICRSSRGALPAVCLQRVAPPLCARVVSCSAVSSGLGASAAGTLCSLLSARNFAQASVPYSCYAGVNHGGGLASTFPHPSHPLRLDRYVWTYSFETGCKNRLLFKPGVGVWVFPPEDALFTVLAAADSERKASPNQPTKTDNPFVECLCNPKLGLRSDSLRQI